MKCEFPMVEVKIKQVGGQYGAFECPRCKGRALYKFSAGAGSCDHCGAGFTCNEKSTVMRLAGDPCKVTHWMTLEMEDPSEERTS